MTTNLYNLIHPALLLLVSSCLFDNSDQAGGGSETGNVGGTIIASDNQYVANAEVQLFLAKTSVDSIGTPPEAVQKTLTDQNGNYHFNVSEQDVYTVIANSQTEFAFVDSILISPSSKLVQDIKLKAPGSLTGSISDRVELLSPASTMAYLVGTSFYVNLSDLGTFTINNIPEGVYTLMLIPGQGEFSNTTTTVNIQSGIPTYLSEPIELKYNGIPIPVNMTTSLDSINGHVDIYWSPLKYEHFQEYLIERNFSNNLEPQWELIGRTTDTTLTDLLYGSSSTSAITYSDPRTHKIEYRVRVRSEFSNLDGSSMDGGTYGKSIIEVTSPQTVIPAPNSLSTSYAKNDGSVSISWEPTSYELFHSYLVERNVGSQLTPNWVLINNTLNTSLVDSIYGYSSTSPLNYLDTKSHSIQYRVRIQSNLTELSGNYIDGDNNSISTISVISPKVLIAAPVSVATTYDTLTGTASVSWDLATSNQSSSFIVERLGGPTNPNKWSLVEVTQSTSLIDSIFTKSNDGKYKLDTNSYNVAYRITEQLNKKLGDGNFQTGNSSVSNNINVASPSIYYPRVVIGGNQDTQPNTEVALVGSATGLIDILKTEWKVGDNDWVNGDSVTYITEPILENKTTLCTYRAINTSGDTTVSSLNIFQSIVKNEFAHPFYLSQPVGHDKIYHNYATLKHLDINKYLYAAVDYSNIKIWSSNDMNNWKFESFYNFDGTVPKLLSFKDNVIAFSDSVKFWSTNNGIDWISLETTFPDSSIYSAQYIEIYSFSDNLFLSYYNNGTMTILTSTDGKNWQNYDKFSSIPFTLFDYQGTVCYYNYKIRKCHENGTWEDAPLWDLNFDSSPDRVLDIASNGDFIFAIFYDELTNQSDIKYKSKDQAWKNIPVNLAPKIYWEYSKPNKSFDFSSSLSKYTGIGISGNEFTMIIHAKGNMYRSKFTIP